MAADTQNSGDALFERNCGLEEAVATFDACLTVVVSAWPDEWFQDVRRRRDDAQAEIARRRPK